MSEDDFFNNLNVLSGVGFYEKISKFNIKKYNFNTLTDKRSFSTSSSRNGLEEFFDDRDNWTFVTVHVGRPWEIDELRIKSNSDLHKLWYVLLKERNMLMTMEEFYDQEAENMPSRERKFKVEQSMENILTVVKERDEAYNLLEKGETGEPEIIEDTNFLGIKYKRRVREHSIPKEKNRLHNLLHPEPTRGFEKFVRLYNERLKKEERHHNSEAKKYKEKLLEKFPNLKNNSEFMAKDPCEIYPIKFHRDIWDDVDDDYYSQT